MPTLHLIRGLPGSGKSTLAENLAWSVNEAGGRAYHFEADHYFMAPVIGRPGVYEYKFDAKRLPEALDFCFRRTREELLAGNDVTVSNTFVTHGSMARYRELVDELNAMPDRMVILLVTKCCGPWKSVHSVPDDVMARMRRQWED